MRLSVLEREALARALKGVPHDAFLFGSRCEDARRGGDVDVLIWGGNLILAPLRRSLTSVS